MGKKAQQTYRKQRMEYKQLKHLVDQIVEFQKERSNEQETNRDG